MDAATIKTWPDGTPIEGFEAKITSAFDRETGEGKKGPWWRDDYVVEDPEGADIRVKHWNSPHSRPFAVGEVLAIHGKTSIYEGECSINGRGSKIHPLGKPDASAPSGGSTPAKAFKPTSTKATLTIEECMALAVRVRAELSENGWTDEQAIMAHCNTLIIGLQKGQIQAFSPQTEAVPESSDSGFVPPGSEDGAPPLDAPSPEPTDDDIPF